MKFIKKIFTIISIIMTFCLCSCQNEAFSNADALTVSDSTAVLTLNIDNGAGRSAAPDIDFSDLTWIELFAINTDVSDDYGRIIGEWRTIEELNVAKINIPVGRYTFTMSCDTAGVFFSDKQTVAVTAGSNALTFRPRLAFADTITGRGNLNVTITYPTDGIAAVTGGLYTLDGENAGSSYIDEDLTTDLTTDGGCSTYSKTGVSCGEYLVVFRFYGDAEKTLLRGIYREYCWLTNGKTSSSNCSISSVPGLFSITFEKNGGMFAGGSTVPGSYTRFSDTVTLPTADTITKAGSTFGGWYDNEGLTGEPVTQIPSGSIGNKTYYAKWIENAAVTFDKNDAGATITTSAQSVQRGVVTNLLTASVLGLANNGKRFFGWAEASDGAVKYYDGDAITLTEDKTLYAIWSATAINPDDENDTTDTDGDGLFDWYELNVSHTDPSNSDTDGDGWSDGDEIEMRKQNANAFSPLIADTPAIEVMLADEPIIEYVYQLADGKTGSQSTVKYFG
ncbi:MAG: InlB B-repeat-containing protein, partial [Spirochaetales bacterium]|nr:InlB B-repeat-containing protein [Spirochaetales bacterium]